MLLSESDKFLTINMSFAIFSVTFRLWHSNFWSIWWQKFAENSWEKKTILPLSRTQQHTSAHQLQKLSTHKVNCLQNITLLKTHQEANFRRKSKLPASLAQPCQRARGGHIKIFYTPCSSKFLNPSGKTLFFLIIILYQILRHGYCVSAMLHLTTDNKSQDLQDISKTCSFFCHLQQSSL